MNLGEKLARIIETNEAENRALREKEEYRKKMKALAKRNELEKTLETISTRLVAKINAGRVPSIRTKDDVFKELRKYTFTGVSPYKDVIKQFFDNFRNQGVDIELVIGMDDEFETTYIINLVPIINKENS